MNPIQARERVNPNVHLCAKCQEEYGGGIADLGDNACSFCGQHDAPNIYVPLSHVQSLEAEVERLREALGAADELEEALVTLGAFTEPNEQEAWTDVLAARQKLRVARAALDTTTEGGDDE